MNNLQRVDSEIANLIIKEVERQESEIELIASENYASKAVIETLGTALINKYSEGYVGKRYYGGNDVIDEIESLAMSRAKELFGCEHVNVQPLSGSPANAAVYFATIKPGDKVMGLQLDHGGHLSHGHPVNFSGMLYNFVQYKVDPQTARLDMDQIRDIALKERPKMLLAGFSAYSRDIDWKAFKSIADEIDAITFADIAHIAGLVAGQVIDSPVPYFDIVSTTTHKTLRGPRGAIIMCKDQYAKAIDRAVFPGMQGGPHDNITAAKAVAFKEALAPEFRVYASNVIRNAKTMVSSLQELGYKIVSDGTDNHLLVVDMTSKGLSGKVTEVALEKVGISASRSTIPYDTRKPMDPSGVRLGTAAVTSRGMDEGAIKEIVEIIDLAVQNHDNDSKLIELKAKVKQLSARFPLYL
jgi:glycine hydroxymethyltransferase